MAEAVGRRAGPTIGTSSSGRHRHRQVAGLPRPGPAPRPAGRGRDRHPRPPAPAGRARHPTAGRGGRRRPTPRSTRRTPCSRAAPTTPVSSGSARGRPTTSRAALVEVPQTRRSARRCSSCGPGPSRRPRTAAAASATAPPPHRPRVAAGQRQPPRLPRGGAMPVRRGVLRRGRPRGGPPLHLIVTNHSLLAIDAIEGVPMIPDYDVVVVDEAHEVVARVTQAATDELLASDVDRASRRSRRYVESGATQRLVRGRRPRRRRRRPRRRDRRVPAGPVRRGAGDAGRRARAGARRRARLPLGVPQGGRLRRARRRPHPGPRLGPGRVRHRRADGCPFRVRRALAERGR